MRSANRRRLQLGRLALLALWALIAVVGTFVVPSVQDAIATSSVAPVPADAPSTTALTRMDMAFGTGRARSFVTIVIENDGGISRRNATYAHLVRSLRQHPDRFVEVQDFLRRPEAREVLTSSDGQATYVAVALASPPQSPASIDDYRLLQDLADEAEDAGDGRTAVGITGVPAIASDLIDLADDAARRVTFISLGLILVLLLLIYRRPVTVLVPLISIGIAMAGTHAAVSLLAGPVLSVSTYTLSLTDAIVLGAVTDYSVFLLSRFREEYRETGDPAIALSRARARVFGPIAASAGTVMLATVALHFTDLPLFVTTGPPMAVGVAVSLLVGLTATPALIGLLGRHIGPAKPEGIGGRWSRTGHYVASRPVRTLALGLGALAVLAGFLPTATVTYNDFFALPEGTPSAAASETLAQHFPANVTTPEYLLIEVDHDLRNRSDLAALEATARAMAEVPGVAEVRGATRPDGQTLSSEQVLASSQLTRPFLARDGRVTRLQVVLDEPAGSPESLDVLDEVRRTAESASEGTPIEEARISSVGGGALTADIRDYLHDDAGFVLIAVLLAVFLVLAVTLRSLVAPTYLLVSVAVSVLAAIGLTVAVFDGLLDQELSYSAPVVGFVLLVAVGADYNILLMSRLRESGTLTDQDAVARTVAATGPVITSAGLIFAGAFVALVTSDIAAIAQTSFALTVGLLLDTFVVRTLVVPPIAALLGQANWWPHRRSRGQPPSASL